VIFREPAASHPATGKPNTPAFTTLCELGGPWDVSFDPKWGGPRSAKFDSLVSWTQRPEEGIKFYSGTAVYRTTFDRPKLETANASPEIFLDLGGVREIAEVKLNGRPLGIVWSPPFRVNLTPALKPAGNILEIEVVNFWPNRIIGDASKPPERRLSRTNIRKLTEKTPLIESGLLGPVQLQTKRNP
jgi:hypothetical protein